MMYLKEANIGSYVKKQLWYKINSNPQIFYGLMVIQIIALLISLAGVGAFSSGSNNLTFHMVRYSGEISIVLTFIWILNLSMIITSKNYTNIDFTLVSSRLTSNLSNFWFVLCCSFLGAITASLSGIVLRVIFFVTKGNSQVLSDGFIISLTDIFKETLVILLYMMLIASLGYFFGTLVQVSKVFVFLIPSVIISLFIYEARMKGGFFYSIIIIFTNETSLTMFTVKAISAIVLIFGLSMIISNTLEVRK